MMKRMMLILVALAITVVLASCSDNSGTGPGSNSLWSGHNYNDENSDSTSVSYLPGSTKGEVLFQRQFSCPIGDYDVDAKVSCKIYSYENQLSSVTDISASDGSTRFSAAYSFVIGYDGEPNAVGLVTWRASGHRASEVNEGWSEKMCSELKRSLGAALTVTCEDTAIKMEGSQNIRERSQVIENWKSQCANACSDFL